MSVPDALSWCAGAARWLWVNRAEAASLVSLPPTLFWLWWNHSYRPPPIDPVAFDAWRRRERFAFAIWHLPGFRPKGWAPELDIQAPPSRPPPRPSPPTHPAHPTHPGAPPKA